MSSISAPAFAANVVSPSVSSPPIMFFAYTNKASGTLNISNGKATIRGYKPNLWAKDMANILVEGKTSLNTLKQKTLSEGIINASLCLE